MRGDPDGPPAVWDIGHVGYREDTSQEICDWFQHTQIEHLRVLDAGPDRRARDYGTLRRDLLLHDAI